MSEGECPEDVPTDLTYTIHVILTYQMGLFYSLLSIDKKSNKRKESVKERKMKSVGGFFAVRNFIMLILKRNLKNGDNKLGYYHQ